MRMPIWTWLAAGVLVLALCGCHRSRSRVTVINPTFRYSQPVDSTQAAALWDELDSPDLVTTRSAAVALPMEAP